MQIVLDLDSEIERRLKATAEVRGLSLIDFIREVVTREAGRTVSVSGTGHDLIDACAGVRGLLSDQEIDSLFGRRSDKLR